MEYSSWIFCCLSSAITVGVLVAEFKERIDEVYKYQHKLWEIVDDDSGKVHARSKVEAIGKLLNCTSSLVELYDCMPVMAAIREYDDSGGGNGFGNGMNGNGGSCSRHCSDFDDEESRYRCDFHSQQYELGRHERNEHNHNNLEDLT